MPQYNFGRYATIAGTVILVILAGMFVSRWPTHQPSAEGRTKEPAGLTPSIEEMDLDFLFPRRVDPDARDYDREHHVTDMVEEIQRLFGESSNALAQGEFQLAVDGLMRIKEIRPALPAVNVNLGFAYLGLKQYANAEHEFQLALQLSPGEPAVYYGLALVYENRHEMNQAVAYMRTFIHLAPQEHQFRRKAESAVWEWESRMQSTDASQ